MESAPSDTAGVTLGTMSTEDGKKKKVEETVTPNQGDATAVAQWPATEGGKKKKLEKESMSTMGGQGNEVGDYGRNMKEESQASGTVEREKIVNVARFKDFGPKSPKSVLGKQGQIKTKIIDEIGRAHV